MTVTEQLAIHVAERSREARGRRRKSLQRTSHAGMREKRIPTYVQVQVQTYSFPTARHVGPKGATMMTMTTLADMKSTREVWQSICAHDMADACQHIKGRAMYCAKGRYLGGAERGLPCPALLACPQSNRNR